MNTQLYAEVSEAPDPYDGYAKTNKVFTFPITWILEQCVKWCNERNYNPFVFGTTDDGAHQFTCAYSWRLSYFNQFGEWPQE